MALQLGRSPERIEEACRLILRHLQIGWDSDHGGALLLAVDAVYQKYSDTELFGAVYEDQWALQFGAQYAPNDRCRWRVGYAWNENPMRDAVGDRGWGRFDPGWRIAFFGRRAAPA